MTAFSLPDTVRVATYKAPTKGGLFIDATTANQGYVTAGYVGDKSGYDRLKFQVRRDGNVYNYDFSYKPVQYPVNMGSGTYLFRIMERVEGNRYAEVMCVSKTVKLRSPYVPYTVPNVFCNYDTSGPCVKKARTLCAKCKTEVEALDAVSGWVARNVAYDYDKARKLASSTGYVPNPATTLRTKKGICFDYASLTAAMLRSVGVPCRVVTGYIDGGYYHSWVSAYADGRWRRRDPTMMAANTKSSTYRNRFIY